MSTQAIINEQVASNTGAAAAQKKLNLSVVLAAGTATAAGLSAALPAVAAYLPPTVLAIVTGIIAVLNIITKGNVQAGVVSALLTPSPLADKER